MCWAKRRKLPWRCPGVGSGIQINMLPKRTLTHHAVFSHPSFPAYLGRFIWLLPCGCTVQREIVMVRRDLATWISTHVRGIRWNSEPLFWAMHHAPHTTWCLHQAPLSILYQSFLEQAPKKWSMNQVVNEPSGSFKAINPLG